MYVYNSLQEFENVIPIKLFVHAVLFLLPRMHENTQLCRPMSVFENVIPL